MAEPSTLPRPLVPLRPPRRPPVRPSETKDVAGGASAAALKVVEPQTGLFEGYASLFDIVDLGRDAVMRGAFAESLRRRGAGGVRMLWQHDPGQPIGAWTLMHEDERGLFVRGALNLSVARAREVHALLRQGAIDGLSIGYRAVTARMEPRTGIRRLTRVDLWEVSVVTFPLLPQARVVAVKANLAACDPAALAGLVRRGRPRPGRWPAADRLFAAPAHRAAGTLIPAAERT